MVDLTDLEDKLRLHAETIMDAAVDVMVTELQLDVPVVTGDLLQSIGREGVVVGDVLTCVIYADSEHAVFVDQGTVPHIIAPTQPHGLLVWEADGQVVFHSGEVHHPGTAANPFFSQRMPSRWEDCLQQAAYAVVTV